MGFMLIYYSNLTEYISTEIIHVLINTLMNQTKILDTFFLICKMNALILAVT